MKGKMKFKGQDVNEAIERACTGMRVSREDLDIEIKATGSTGIFGLCRKPAIVLVSLKNGDKAADKAADSDQAGSDKEKAKPKVAKVDTVKGDTAEAQKSAPQKKKPAAKAAAQKDAKPAPAKSDNKPQATSKTTDDSSAQAQPRKNKGNEPRPLDPEVVDHVIADLEQILKMMNMPSSVSVAEKEGKTLFSIEGDHVGHLVGKDGYVLDSLQYLLWKMSGKKYPQRVMFGLDAGGFRQRRQEELEELALKLAAEVKEVGKTRTIAPLNPAERRIVHVLLQQDKTIRSRSVGDGLFKKILIYLPGKGRKRSGRPGGNRKKQNRKQ